MYTDILLRVCEIICGVNFFLYFFSYYHYLGNKSCIYVLLITLCSPPVSQSVGGMKSGVSLGGHSKITSHGEGGTAECDTL